MFRFITLTVCIALASAGIIPEHHGLHTYSLPTVHDTIIDHHHPHHHHPHSAITLSAAPTIIKYAAPAPTIVKYAEPIVLKSYAPLAESYSNVHKLSYKIPVAHHHHGHHSAAIALPSYHGASSFELPSTYHSLPSLYSSHGGVYGGHGFGHEYGHGYGHGYGHLYGGDSFGHHGLLH